MAPVRRFNLTPEVIAHVVRYVEALAVEVTVTPNPERPLRSDLRVMFNPARVGLHQPEASPGKNGYPRARC